MKSSMEINIGSRKIGKNHPCFIIGEIGTNHNGDINKARELVRVLAKYGADSVKFQLYEAHDIVSKKITTKDYSIQDTYGNISMYEAFDKYLRTPQEWLPELVFEAKSIGLIPICTAHSYAGAMFLEEIGMEAIKIASMDLTNIPMIQKISEKVNLPIIISVGMAELNEISMTVDILKNNQSVFSILHCVSNYPAKYQDMRLQNISVLDTTYKVPIGFSDHSLDHISAIASVVLGASILEKHITMDRSLNGPDHHFALEPKDFNEMVSSIRSVEAAYSRQSGFSSPGQEEIKKRLLYRRSLVSAKQIYQGSYIKSDDIKISRPGTGIPPFYLDKVVGRAARKNIPAETILTWDLV